MQLSLVCLLGSGASIISAAAVTPRASDAKGCTSLSTRIEWRNYSASDREAFVDAIPYLTKYIS